MKLESEFVLAPSCAIATTTARTYLLSILLPASEPWSLPVLELQLPCVTQKVGAQAHLMLPQAVQPPWPLQGPSS